MDGYPMEFIGYLSNLLDGYPILLKFIQPGYTPGEWQYKNFARKLLFVKYIDSGLPGLSHLKK